MADLNTLVNLYSLNSRLMGKVLEGVSDDMAKVRPLDKGNAIVFVMGHLLFYRYYLAGLLGSSRKCPWEGPFDSAPTPEQLAKYPKASEMLANWNAFAPEFESVLKKATPEQLATATEWGVEPCGKTVRGVLEFMAFHEGYHIGQLGYIRRLHGLERAFG